MKHIGFLIYLAIIVLSFESSSVFGSYKTNNRFTCIYNFHEILKSGTLKNGPIVSGENSFSSSIPNFKNFRDELLEKRPSIKKFIRRYKAEHDKYPTVLQSLEFFFQAHDSIVRHINSIRYIDTELDHFLEIASRSLANRPKQINLFKQMKRSNLSALYEPVDLDLRRHIEIIEKFGINNYLGPLGELDAVFRLENVIAQEVYFNNMMAKHEGTREINLILNNAVKNKFKNLRPKHLNVLKKRYPNVFKDPRGTFTNEEILLRSEQFFNSKELDLIVKNGTGYTIVEVKNYKGGMTLKDLKGSGYKKKTVLNQLEELKEMLSFLELELQFTPALLSMKGISKDARKHLEKMNIIVLGKNID